MDRRWRRAALICTLALAVPASAQPPLRAERWLAAGADPRVLTRIPAECRIKPASADEALSVEIGRAAFRSPTLLGGQAARAGLACDSCHRNGRTNPDFHFPGVSGAPGTADVTSSLFSSHRGDDLFNPKPIPDLGGPKDRLKVAQDGDALHTFIHGLITEEFDGHEPPARVLDGLVAYVRSLQACDAVSRPLHASDYASDAVRAVDAAQGALAKGDTATARVLIAAARARLGLIAERYPQGRFPSISAQLLKADGQLQDARDAATAAETVQRLAAWRRDAAHWRRAVERAEPRSLFNPARLAGEARLPQGGP